MKENIIQVQYCDNQSIVTITRSGHIKRIFVPFKVICIKAVDNIPFKAVVHVEEVLSNERDQLIYLIWGKHFFHFYFLIIQT